MSKSFFERGKSFFDRELEIGQTRIESMRKAAGHLIQLLTVRHSLKYKIMQRQYEDRIRSRQDNEGIINFELKMLGNRILADHSMGATSDDDTLAKFFLRDPRKTLDSLNFNQDQKELFESRSMQVIKGATIGRHILDRTSAGLSLDIQDGDGKIIGNWADEFRAIPPDITFNEMGFNETQIQLLDEKTYFPVEGTEPRVRDRRVRLDEPQPTVKLEVELDHTRR